MKAAVAVVLPAGIVTLLALTVATLVVPLEIDTTAPPVGAAALSVMVPEQLEPARTVEALSVKLLTVGFARATSGKAKKIAHIMAMRSQP